MFDEFYTSRLYIRILSKQDVSFIYNLLNTQGWIKFIGDRKIHSLVDAEDYIEKISSDPDSTYWTIMTKANDIPIGVLTFIKRSYLEHYDIGYAALPEYTGLGLIREGCEMLISRILSLDANRAILATVLPENAPSVGLLRRLGFNFLRDQVVDEEILHVYRFN